MFIVILMFLLYVKYSSTFVLAGDISVIDDIRNIISSMHTCNFAEY